MKKTETVALNIRFFHTFANVMLRINTIILILLLSIPVFSKNATEDYDSLSQLSTARLMESGRDYFEQRQAGKALSCFTIVSERYKEPDADRTTLEQSIRAMNNCGCVYKYFYYDYPSAYEYFSRAYDLCEEIHFDDFLPVILVNMGDLLNDYGVNYHSEALAQQAGEIFEKCIKSAYEKQQWDLLTTAFFNLANQNYGLELKKYDFIFSEEIPDSTSDLAFVRLQYKGLAAMQKHRYAEARQYFQDQLPVVTARWEADRDTLSSYISIAKTYSMERNYVQAADYLNRALQMSLNNGINDHAAGLCKQLAECYQLMGDSSRQQYYHLLYLEKMEQMHNSRLSHIGELNYISSLKKEEARALELNNRQRMQQYLIVGVVIILMVVISSVVQLFRQNRKLHVRNRSLFEKYQQVIRAEAAVQRLRKTYEAERAEKTLEASVSVVENAESSSETADSIAESGKYSRSGLKEAKRESLLFQIQEVLDNPDIICQQDFSLGQMAKLVDSNTTYVSQVINEKYGLTFSIVLGNYRVKEACRRITENSEYDKLTIEAIATSVGFKSRTAFITAFKREVGLTPSEFIRMASK